MGDKRKNKASNKSQNINKSASENVTTSAPNIRNIGSEAYEFIDDLVEISMPYDLQWPQRLKTFDLMEQNSTIQVGLYMDRMFTSKAFRDVKFSYSKNTKSKEASEFLEYMFSSMEKPLSYYVREATNGYRKDGFSIHYKAYKEYTTGEYNGKLGIKRLSWRDPRTLDGVDPFVYTRGGRDIKTIRQSREAFLNTDQFGLIQSKEYFGSNTYIDIPYARCLVYGEDFSAARPLGFTPLMACYKDWKKMHLIDQLETSGVTKDMAGLLEIKIPKDVLDRASEDPKGRDAAFVRKYMKDAANIHQGKQSFVMTPSDMLENSTTAPAYALNLKGIDGGGKQYKTSDIIKVLKKNILDVFGAGFLVVGTDTAGSYNLAEAGQSMHSYFIEDHVEHVRSMYNDNLIPEVLAANGFLLNFKDTPKMICSPIGEHDVETASKMTQRLRATNSIVLTKQNIINWHERNGFDTEHMEELNQEELIELLTAGQDEEGSGGMQSRSGDGMTSGLSNGVGNVDGSGGNANDSNLTTKSLSNISVLSDDGTIAEVQIGNNHFSIPSEDVKDWS